MKLELQDATKRYGRTTALKDASVVFEPGQLVAVLGLNGAGKTTLLIFFCAFGNALEDGPLTSLRGIPMWTLVMLTAYAYSRLICAWVRGQYNRCRFDLLKPSVPDST